MTHCENDSNCQCKGTPAVVRCARPDCSACETERTGCRCDALTGETCFLCAPASHSRPTCLPALTDEEFRNKTYTCLHCGKDTGGPTNYCNWGCLEAYNRAHGGKEHLPNGLPVRSIRHDGLMLECEHGDHPDYLFPVLATYIGPTPESEYEYGDELHALIYTDGHVALTLYETEPHLWLAGVPYRQRDGREGKFRLADESMTKIAEYVATKNRQRTEAREALDLRTRHAWLLRLEALLKDSVEGFTQVMTIDPATYLQTHDWTLAYDGTVDEPAYTIWGHMGPLGIVQHVSLWNGGPLLRKDVEAIAEIEDRPTPCVLCDLLTENER
jgi:hypothetical protein